MSSASGHDLFAVAAPGLEPLLARELKALGMGELTVLPGGVAFQGGDDALAVVHLWLRTASRVLLRAGTFTARSFAELERHAMRLPWDAWLTPGEPVRFRVSCRHSRLYHSGAVAERLLGAAGARASAVAAPPLGDDEQAGVDEQLVVVRVDDDRCTVSLDASGALLHRRGYRQATAKAPLRETLAAAILLAAAWDGTRPFCDPLCGSGTLAIEAALIARRLAPGRQRRFRFMEWPRWNERGWLQACERADAQARSQAGVPLLASDHDPGAIRATLHNAARAGVADDLRVDNKPLSALTLPQAHGLVASNLPYGTRIHPGRSLRPLYRELGQQLRRHAPGWSVALLVADAALGRAAGLPLASALRTRNGGIAVELLAGVVPADLSPRKKKPPANDSGPSVSPSPGKKV